MVLGAVGCVRKEGGSAPHTAVILIGLYMEREVG